MGIYINDGSKREPRLRRDINRGSLIELPEWSKAPKVEGLELLIALKESGYEGIQGADPDLCREAGLACTGSFRSSSIGVIDELVKERKEKGFEALTTHAGWGMEDDEEMDAYAVTILEASEKYSIPIYVETHRATMTQDIWRTVQLVQRQPQLHYNADFSHWFTGLEMPYGDLDEKLNFLKPVFDRIGFFHGRIGNASHIQIPFEDGEEHVETFKEMWTRSMVSFLEKAQPGDVLPFNPELLPPSSTYAREFKDSDGNLREESDRWEQAMLMSDIAQDCFREAQSRLT